MTPDTGAANPSDTVGEPINHHYAMALGAFILWGLFPVFFKQLSHIDALETLAHRLLWSALLIGFFIAFKLSYHLPKIIQIAKKHSQWLLITASLISFNWGIYLYAINTDRILDASLGYFISPLINIAIGLVFFKERLNKVQCIALLLAIFGAINEILRLGGLPWISMGAAISFAFYAGVRKHLNVDSTYAFLLETLLFLPISLGYLAYLYFGSTGMQHLKFSDLFYFILCGLLTLLPLTWFNQAARFVPLSSLSLFQYITPSMIFFFGFIVYKEPLDFSRLLSFACIWVGLGLIVCSHFVRQIKIQLH